MSRVVSIQQRRMESILTKELEKAIDQKSEDMVLFKRIVEKGINKLNEDEKLQFDEAECLGSFLFNNKNLVFIVKFRHITYLIHDMLDGSYEYIGTMEDLLNNYIE